jgi:hypothetical protein
LAILNPTQQSNYLPACPAWRCSSLCSHPHARPPPPFSRPLLITDLGSAPLPLAPTPHALHTIASAMLTPTPPPNYLHAPPGDARRAAHIRIIAGFPSASDQPPVCPPPPMYICTCTNTRWALNLTRYTPMAIQTPMPYLHLLAVIFVALRKFASKKGPPAPLAC